MHFPHSLFLCKHTHIMMHIFTHLRHNSTTDILTLFSLDVKEKTEKYYYYICSLLPRSIWECTCLYMNVHVCGHEHGHMSAVIHSLLYGHGGQEPTRGITFQLPHLIKSLFIVRCCTSRPASPQASTDSLLSFSHLAV